jgi:hypothetical protein
MIKQDVWDENEFFVSGLIMPSVLSLLSLLDYPLKMTRSLVLGGFQNQMKKVVTNPWFSVFVFILGKSFCLFSPKVPDKLNSSNFLRLITKTSSSNYFPLNHKQLSFRDFPWPLTENQNGGWSAPVFSLQSTLGASCQVSSLIVLSVNFFLYFIEL